MIILLMRGDYRIGSSDFGTGFDCCIFRLKSFTSIRIMVQPYLHWKSMLKNSLREHFIVPASFYLADCQDEGRKKGKRIKDFETVIAAPRSEFTESALLKAATIRYGLEKYDTSLIYYTSLENLG